MEFFANRIWLIALTFGAFYLAKRLQQRTGWVVLNPILIACVLIIGTLLLTGVDYETYYQAGSIIDFWLKPSVVALGVPLYRQMKKIRANWLPILVSQLTGCVVGLCSVTLIAKWLGATPEVIASLAPKSVTTPIAIEVSESLGGIPSLTAAVVIVTGILGAVFGFKVLHLGRVQGDMAMGISLGTASHALGTATAMERGSDYGAYASLGLTLNGIFTALLAPWVIDLLGVL